MILKLMTSIAQTMVLHVTKDNVFLCNLKTINIGSSCACVIH